MKIKIRRLLISIKSKWPPKLKHNLFYYIIKKSKECVIAPDLFNCVIDHLMRRLLSRCNLGIQLGEYQLTDLDYSDDIAIYAPSACVLQEALTILQEEANLVGMQISWPKTKLMAITPKPTNHLPLKICNKEVVFVDSFTYLGSLITNDGSSSRDITSRIAKAASAMCRLSNPLFRKHRISIRTKINMYRALVVSVLLHGSEAWATTLADRRRLDVFDMHALPKAPPACVLAAARQQPKHP